MNLPDNQAQRAFARAIEAGFFTYHSGDHHRCVFEWRYLGSDESGDQFVHKYRKSKLCVPVGLENHWEPVILYTKGKDLI